MHITALCPFCRSAYQVQEKLRGQFVRCPNTACRKVFSVPSEPSGTEVPAASTPPRPDPQSGGSQRSGSVGDIVPMLPTEPAAPSQGSSAGSKHVSEILPVEPATREQPSESDWWQTANPPAAPSTDSPTDAAWWSNAPPVRKPQTPVKSGETPVPSPSPPTQRRRRSARPPAETKTMPARPPGETQPMPVLPPEKPDQPRELPPGTWEPPPVRRGAENPEQPPQTLEETAEAPSRAEIEEEAFSPRLSKRRALRLIVIVLLALFFILGGSVFLAWKIFHQSEEGLYAEASEFYSQGSFGAAEGKFRLLMQRFPSSERSNEYKFMADWCDVCGAVADPDADLTAAAEKLDQFVKKNKKDQLMVQKSRDAGLRLIQLAKEFAARNTNPTDEAPLAVAERIEQLRHTVTTLRADALTKSESGQIDADLSKVRRAVELASKRRNVLSQLHKRDDETPMDAIKRVRSLLARMEHELPGIGQSDEAKAASVQLEETHLASVVYRQPVDAPAPAPQLAVDDADVMLFAPLLPPAAPRPAPPNDPIVLALVRGVLYALKQSNGELKWATHVGIDTTVLPQRVPASTFSPELLLVISADTQTLSALNVEGDLIWEYHIGHPVLGRPIIIEHRAYLADYSGWVHEIELSGGQMLGRWFLGQPLTSGGAREGDTSRIYFPADDSCIYVLDVNPRTRRCVTILYDGHPSGSLRSEPVIIPPEGDAAPGYLILNQASGLDEMQLRVFELPLLDRHAPPLVLKPPARFPGWTWFEPKEDGEKLAVLSDDGRLGLFGIRQLGNRDPALFPLLQPRGLDLSSMLRQPVALARGQELTQERGRSQVVHMQGDDLWVLAHGRFQQLQLHMDPEKGPQARPSWKSPLPLGSPLHEPQRMEEPNGRSSFILVTQALEQQTCLATKVDEQGEILWQRQLGLVCQGEPLALTPPKGGPPLLLALDRSGGLFALDPLQPNKRRLLRNAPALAENPLVSPRLLPAADGRSAYEIAFPGAGQEMIVRRIEWADDKRELRVQERKVKLLSQAGDAVLMPAGTPALTRSQLLIPMSDGNVKGLPLAELWKEEEEQPLIQTGPGWRDMRTPIVAPCTVLSLGGDRDRFLTTNGNRSLSVFEWPPDKDKDWQRLPKEGDGEPLKPLEYLVAAPPVLLPSGDSQSPRVVVADSFGVLRLFTVTPSGALQPGPTWELKGNLTAGPFVQAAPEGGWRIGCVLDRRRLLWIDPAKPEPSWTYSTDGPAILGQPRRVEDMLVLALQSGRYVGIDPKTGQLKGPGYSLRTSAAPAATPQPFGPGRMFAPLSDGTALLLSVNLLKKN